MNKRKRYSPEFRDRAVRLVEEQQKEGSSEWAAIHSLSEKLGCVPETLRRWVRQSQRDQGKRAGLTTDERARLKQLEKENRELKRSNEILKKGLSLFCPVGARPPTGLKFRSEAISTRGAGSESLHRLNLPIARI